MTKPDVKSFAIPKLLVWEAWRRVKANTGAPGVDGQDLDEFEKGLESDLYKIWNRMSSGTEDRQSGVTAAQSLRAAWLPSRRVPEIEQPCAGALGAVDIANQQGLALADECFRDPSSPNAGHCYGDFPITRDQAAEVAGGALAPSGQGDVA